MSSGDGSSVTDFTAVASSSLPHLSEKDNTVYITNTINTNSIDTSYSDVPNVTNEDKGSGLNSPIVSNEYKRPDDSTFLTCPVHDSNVSSSEKSPKKNYSTITPLSLPKRFSNVQSFSTSKVSDKPLEVLESNQPQQSYLQPVQQMCQLQPYQQMFYNTQTGTIITLPVAAPPYMHSNFSQGNPFVMLPARNSQSNQLQSQSQSQSQLPQIVYIKTANGQLVPVLTSAAGYPTIDKHPFQQSQQGVSSILKNEAPISPSSISPKNKKQKVSPPLVSSATQAAERIQRQQIHLQTQMHPNLNEELATPNISDIYEKGDNGSGLTTIPTVTTAAANKVNLLGSPADSNSADEIYNDDTQNNQQQSQLTESVQLSENSTESIRTSSSHRIIGSVTLGQFTYKYSQTLSGNLVKDRELFDRLTDNAWNSCIAKLQ